MRLWHRHHWTMWGPPYTRWATGYGGHRSFQACTCEDCGKVRTRKLRDGEPAAGINRPTEAPPVPIERDMERLR